MSRPRPERAIAVARYDLDTAIALARPIHASGRAPAPLRQIALASNPDTNPDTFMHKVYDAAKYGLMALQRERIGATGHAVTLPLLGALDDPSREQGARVTAFLNIALHRAVAEHYRDRIVPPDPAVQRILVAEFRISTGQVASVRRVLLRSLR